MATPKNTAKKNEKKGFDLEEIRTRLVKEFDAVSVDSMLPLLGDTFETEEALVKVLSRMKERDAAEKARRENEKKENDKKKEARNKATEEALGKVFKSIGVKSVPDFFNDVRDEARNIFKVLTKGGEKEKVHDRDLIGLRFTSGRFNFCFQAEIPFERLTGSDKYTLSKEEHAKEKERILGEIAKTILGAFDANGAFVL